MSVIQEALNEMTLMLADVENRVKPTH